MLKSHKSKIIILLFAFVCLIGLSVAIFQIIKYQLDAEEIKNQATSAEEKVKITEVADNENTEIIAPAKEEESLYWKYIKMNLLEVDFSELKEVNGDVRGWLKVEGTNINYPFVQTDNNDFYLTHALNKAENSAGWVFLDYRNNLSGEDKNTIIYAHGRTDTTMFGTLKNILTSGWLDDSDNFIVRLSTEYENTLWQVFSVYKVPTTSDYLQTDFSSDWEFLEFTNLLLERSVYDFQTSLSGAERILTLSTCFADDERVVLHAKLIKRELK